MRRPLIQYASFSVLLVAFAAMTATAQEPADARISLRILYLGQPGTARMEDFLSFFRENFQEVKAGDVTQFRPSEADGFDVVIVDGEQGQLTATVTFPSDFSRPTVLHGSYGALVASRAKLKIGYG